MRCKILYKMVIHTVLQQVKIFIKRHPALKTVLGVVLVIIGIAALVTPLTPGSWLALIGLELLGLRIVLRDWALKQKEIYIDQRK